jgi:hypothetical protein
MRRFWLLALFLPLAGCTLPAERVPLQPLPENGQALPYPDLLTRIRAQARASNDAYYLDHWNDLEDLAKGIEQTARFLSKAQEVPAKNRDTLNEVTRDLGKSAVKLREAAAAKDVDKALKAMTEINSKVRQLLRLTD